jgi:hypothetical protein
MLLLRRLTVLLSLIALPKLVVAQTGATAPTPPLQGARKVSLAIDVDDNENVVSAERVRTVTELKLRTVGLRVLSREENRADPDINPWVSVAVNVMSVKIGGRIVGYAYCATVAMYEMGRSMRNGALASIVSYGPSSTMGVGPRESIEEQVTDRVVSHLLDELANEWLKANPK